MIHRYLGRQNQGDLTMVDTPEERQAGIRSLERRIKRMEDRGDKTLYLKSCKERLTALKTGEIDRSFGDLYVSGLGRTGEVPGR